MDLMLVLLAVTAFPVACLGFVLWMGVIEDSIPAGVRRAVREPDPAPILAVPVRRTAAPQVTGWWESVAAEPAPVAAGPALDATPALDAIPEQRTPPALPALPTTALPTAALPVLPAPEPLAGT